jgi:hypothetical protein
MNPNILNQIKKRDIPNDEFYTPIELSKKLIQEVPICENNTILDPFFGTGSFFNNFPKNELNDWYELNLGKDFFKYNNKFDWVISNPPFSNLTKTIEHTLNVAEIGFAYIIPTYSLTPHRLKIINSYGFHMSKFIIFENPKEWRIGFQMCFIIFTKKKNDCLKLLSNDNSIQRRLF